MPRVLVVFDGDNVMGERRDYFFLRYGMVLDVEGVVKYFSRPDVEVKAIVFRTVQREGTGLYLEHLEEKGIEVVAAAAEKDENGANHGYPDKVIVDRVVEEVDNFDRFVFVTRDNDFWQLFRFLKSREKTVELVAADYRLGRQLLQDVDVLHDLRDENVRVQCATKPRYRSRPNRSRSGCR